MRTSIHGLRLHGRRGLDIGLSPADLITVTKAKTAAIAR